MLHCHLTREMSGTLLHQASLRLNHIVKWVSMSRVSLWPPHMSTFIHATTHRGNSENTGEERIRKKKEIKRLTFVFSHRKTSQNQSFTSKAILCLFYNTSLEERQHNWFAHNLLCYLYYLLLKKEAARHQRKTFLPLSRLLSCKVEPSRKGGRLHLP